MLLAANSWSPIQSPGGWRPDLRVSLGLALACAVVLFYSFLGLLHKPVAPDMGTLMSLSLVTSPPASVWAHLRKPVTKAAVPAVTFTPPRVEPLPPALDLATLQQQVDTAVRETEQSQQSTGLFLMPPAERYGELDQALRALPKPATLRDGEGYRSMYGQTIVKSRDHCTAEQEVQVSPTGAKAIVGFMVACPGEYQPSMADGLADWAKKVAEGNPPPHR
jgi:hypothetical protein